MKKYLAKIKKSDRLYIERKKKKMKRKNKLEILLGNLDKASADLKKAVEESQKRLDESFAKYEHKVEVAHNETQK